MPNSSRSSFGDLERAILEVLWSVDNPSGATVRDVHEALSEVRDVAYTTVMTVLDRMAKKGVVEQHRLQKAYVYRAAGTREEMTADLMRETLDDLAGAQRSGALVAFVNEASEEELAALRAALDELS
jgi:predicted transcriptional regulator